MANLQERETARIHGSARVAFQCQNAAGSMCVGHIVRQRVSGCATHFRLIRRRGNALPDGRLGLIPASEPFPISVPG
jgi:hypothetical protein